MYKIEILYWDNSHINDISLIFNDEEIANIAKTTLLKSPDVSNVILTPIYK